MVEKSKKKSLWEQMGRDVPPMVSDEMEIKPKEKQPEEEKKPKDKSLWEKMGRKPLFK